MEILTKELDVFQNELMVRNSANISTIAGADPGYSKRGSEYRGDLSEARVWGHTPRSYNVFY